VTFVAVLGPKRRLAHWTNTFHNGIMLPQEGESGMEEQQEQIGDRQQTQNLGEQAPPAVAQRRPSILPEATEQMLQELVDLPGRVLPAETVQHLKNAGRETVLAIYSLWQSANRAARAESGEKVRKHIEVE
jgi:hypothetical protein